MVSLIARLVSVLRLLWVSLLVTSCGFHLQQGMQLAKPLHTLTLQTPDPYGALTRNLQQYLTMSHIKLVENKEEANTVLAILDDNSYQDLLSVSSTQQTRQYNLRVVVTFQITDKHGAIIVPPQTLTESRVITIQSNQILGSSNEANLYYQQIRRTLAGAIINRLASQEVTQLVDQAFAKKHSSSSAKSSKRKPK